MVQALPENLDDRLDEVEEEVENWRRSIISDNRNLLNEIINALKAKL